MEEQRLLLSKQTAENVNDISEENENDDQEDWSESEGSSCSSYYSDSDSSVPEWESSIDESTGELLFIDCHPFVVQNNTESNREKEDINPFTKNQTRRSTRGKFLRLIRRRESKRRSKRYPKYQEVDLTSTKVKFRDFQEGEEREVFLKIENNVPAQKDLLLETLLGLNVSTLSDGHRLMIAGFLPESGAKNEKNIKIGDWLKSINNIDVNNHNVNGVLEQIIGKTEVLLKLQRVTGCDVTKGPPIHELNNQSNFVRQLTNNYGGDDEQLLLESLCKHPIGIIYINTEKLSESGPEYDDIIYCYPGPFQKNVLCNSRGMFITLDHLLPTITKNLTKMTSVLYKNKLAHIVYTKFEQKLLLFMLPDNRANSKEVILINNEILRILEFTYETVDNSLSNEKCRSQVDHFFSRFFARVLSCATWATNQQFVELHHLSTKSVENGQSQFEQILPVAPVLNLPSEAQMQIDDALTELEASDYREWNEEPLDCQRLFTILGSALYHSGFLLASHLIHEDLIDVHCYCRQQGYLHLTKTEPLKSLVLWKEVYPTSCKKNKCANTKIPERKRYLLIVGSTKDLLAVIMEAGGCTEPAEENMGPDAFYVEEVQATLAHIQELGLPELADRWLSMNPGPQITIPEVPIIRRKSDFIGNINFNKTNSQSNLNKDSLQKKPEVTSILKRRSSDHGLPSNTSSVYSLPDDNNSYDAHSEDSGSQGGYSERSEVSDELTKRTKEKKTKLPSDDEESDPEDFMQQDGSQMSNSSFDISELRQTLLSETEDIQPIQLTSGSTNVLFHFVQLDTTEGVIVHPPDCKIQSQTLEVILNQFRESCQTMHNLFQNTIRFKNMPAQDMTKSAMNKSLIAIKEHGVLFECPYLDDRDPKREHKITFWVIGRLFHMPHPREIYVCYQDTVPQNLIELAFKMTLNTIY